MERHTGNKVWAGAMQADVQDLLVQADQHAQSGNQAAAVKTYAAVLAKDPANVPALCGTGLIFEKQNKTNAAQEKYKRVLTIEPDSAPAYLGLGRILQRQGKIGEAEQHFRHSIKLAPSTEAYGHLAQIMHGAGFFLEAAEYYKAALAITPDHVACLNNLGAVYFQMEQYKNAKDCYSKVLEIAPDNPSALTNIAAAFKAFGQLEDTVRCLKESLRIRPGHSMTLSNLLFAMIYAPSVAPQDLYETAKAYGASIIEPSFKKYKFSRDADPDRKLRIGYVSGDFRTHPVNYFFEPLINHHDRGAFEFFGYSNVKEPDAVTARVQKAFDVWRDIKGMQDAAVAELIFKDKIDILVDMAGHTAQNSLPVFARRPAPVQVTWLGYPATTGVAAMDYRITDVHAEPVGMTERLNVEALYRLPDIFCCYQPRERSPDVIDHPPFEDNGYVTFGCFNSFSKVTDAVLVMWGSILERVPDSRLLLEVLGLEEFQKELEQRLTSLGLPLDRVILKPRKPQNHLSLYNKIDIALDPYPCNGGTTSMDCLWMGVPFVTLAGDSFVSRMGVSLLTNAGLPELIAGSEDEYRDKAVALANDRDRLRQTRRGLRERVQNSPLMDQKAFARSMEDAYRAMWRDWLSRQ